jgi:hypothetical protein
MNEARKKTRPVCGEGALGGRVDREGSLDLFVHVHLGNLLDRIPFAWGRRVSDNHSRSPTHNTEAQILHCSLQQNNTSMPQKLMLI